jgi:hypothetical protein
VGSSKDLSSLSVCRLRPHGDYAANLVRGALFVPCSTASQDGDPYRRI